MENAPGVIGRDAGSPDSPGLNAGAIYGNRIALQFSRLTVDLVHQSRRKCSVD